MYLLLAVSAGVVKLSEDPTLKKHPRAEAQSANVKDVLGGSADLMLPGFWSRVCIEAFGLPRMFVIEWYKGFHELSPYCLPSGSIIQEFQWMGPRALPCIRWDMGTVGNFFPPRYERALGIPKPEPPTLNTEAYIDPKTTPTVHEGIF